MANKEGLLEAIEQFQNQFPTQFCITYHNGKTKAINALTEKIEKYGIKAIDGSWDCLMNAKGISFEGSRLGDLGSIYHEQFNSKLSLFLQNGSSMGNQVISLCLSKKKVLIQVNSHISVYLGLQLACANIILIEPTYNDTFGIYLPLTAEQVREAIFNDPEIAAVYLTSPNYEGLIANYTEIKEVCGDRLLIVDEAHGAIEYFGDQMPSPALKSGADVTVCSVHKTLGCLAGTSLLNVSKNSKLSNKKVLDAYHTLNTTTPNIVMMASVEAAVRYLSEKGNEAIQNAIILNSKLRKHLQNIRNVNVDNFQEMKKDPLKTMFSIKGLSGYELGKIMQSEYNISVEKSTDMCVIVTIHINTQQEDIDKLCKAVTKLAQKQSLEPIQETHKKGESLYAQMAKKRRIVMSIIEVQASEKEEIRLSQAVGRISADLKYTCPPGYPFLLQGEVIQEEHLELLGQNTLIEVII